MRQSALQINNPLAEDYFEGQGFTPCMGADCRTWISAQDRAQAEANGGLHNCQHCGTSYEPIEPSLGSFGGSTGGFTRAGMKVTQLGNLGEHIVFNVAAKMPEWQRRYGTIIWQGRGEPGQHEQYHNEIDGVSLGPDGRHWAIEVKAADAGNVRPAFNLGADEKASKHAWVESVPEQFQVQHNLPAQIDSLLGVLPVFDFAKSVVHIWVKEMQRGPWTALNGKTINSWGGFHANPRSGVLLLEDVPFRNPYMDPMSDAPHVHPNYKAPDADPIPF